MRDFSDLANVRSMAQSFADEQQESVILYLRAGRYDFVRETTYNRDNGGCQATSENMPGNAKMEVLQPRYRYLDDIKRRNARIGNHWFEPSTMRFFGSRVHSSIYTRGEVAYFVTSEKPPHARRAYSVRRANPDGSIDTVGEFCGFSTGRAAHARAAWIAEHGE